MSFSLKNSFKHFLRHLRFSHATILRTFCLHTHYKSTVDLNTIRWQDIESEKAHKNYDILTPHLNATSHSRVNLVLWISTYNNIIVTAYM